MIDAIIFFLVALLDVYLLLCVMCDISSPVLMKFPIEFRLPDALLLLKEKEWNDDRISVLRYTQGLWKKFQFRTVILCFVAINCFDVSLLFFLILFGYCYIARMCSRSEA